MSIKEFVGIAEMKASQNAEMVLVAANLGSCLGISVYDTQQHIGALVHCLLPTAQSDPEKAKEKPFMYVDSGLTALLNFMSSKGCQKKDLVIVVAGGSNINDAKNVFEIGKKNFTMLRKVLWKYGLLIKSQDVGGGNSRTLSLEVGSGNVWLKTGGETRQLG